MWYSAAKATVHRARGCRTRSRPGWLCAENEHAPDAERFDSLLHFIQVKRPKVVGIRRTHALGDCIMAVVTLRAVARHVRQFGVERVVLITRRDLAAMFAEMDLPGIGFTRDRGRGVDYGACVLDLNHALQADHRGGWESSKHRLWLYSHALGYEQGCVYQEAA